MANKVVPFFDPANKDVECILIHTFTGKQVSIVKNKDEILEILIPSPNGSFIEFTNKFDYTYNFLLYGGFSCFLYILKNINIKTEMRDIFLMAHIILTCAKLTEKNYYSMIFSSNLKYFNKKFPNVDEMNQSSILFKKYLDHMTIILNHLKENFKNKAELIDKIVKNTYDYDSFDEIIDKFEQKRSSINDFLINIILLFNLKDNIDKDQFYANMDNNKNFYDKAVLLNLRSKDDYDVERLKNFVKDKINQNENFRKYIALIYVTIETFEIDVETTQNHSM